MMTLKKKSRFLEVGALPFSTTPLNMELSMVPQSAKRFPVGTQWGAGGFRPPDAINDENQ